MLNDDSLSFCRQTFVLSACLFSSLSIGLMVAFPGALNPAIMSPNSTDIRATSDQASWIATSNGLAGMVGFLLLPPFMQFYGRKTVQIVLNIFSMTGWIIFIFASSITDLYAARIVQGLKIGGNVINIITMSEYISPARRGYFLILKPVCYTTGILICHAMTINFTWRQIAVLGLVFNLTAIVITLFWPESPPYLAMKGRFDECEKSYLWLNGKSTKGCRELTTLMSTQMERLQKKREQTKRLMLVKFLKQFLDKDFKRAFSIAILIILTKESSGVHYFSVYMIQIMSELVGDKSLAIYYTLGADTMIVCTLFLSCFIIKYFKRRTLLLSFGSIASTMLLLMSLLVFIKSRYNLEILEWVLPCMVILHCISMYLGLIPVCFSLVGEIFSLRHRVVGCCITAFIKVAIYSGSIKVVPLMMEGIGLEYLYAIFGVILVSSLIVMYFILPETKDKTLQDIENDMKGGECTSIEMKSMLTKE